MKYVSLKSGGSLHIVRDGTTVCGREYRRYDYLPVSEDEYDPNRHAVCHKCRNVQRSGPRTIAEAMKRGYER